MILGVIQQRWFRNPGTGPSNKHGVNSFFFIVFLMYIEKQQEFMKITVYKYNTKL